MENAVNERFIPRDPPTGEGLTYEKIWALFQENERKMMETDRKMEENARQIKETDQIIKENARQIKETDKLQKETARQMKETDRKMEETARQMKETDRKMKETTERMGYLSNRFGEMAEHLVAPGIKDKFNELGFSFDGAALGGYIIHNDKRKIIAEIDILLENGESIMAVEVKAKPKIEDFQHHIKRLKILREHLNKKHDSRKILGAFAGAIFGNEAKQAAFDTGFYVLEQSGDTMKMDIPEGFIPKEW